MLAGMPIRRYRNSSIHSVPSKANRVLHLILVGLVLLFIRIWHLTVVEHEQKLESSRRPTRRTVIEPARRATIRDRFNIPLAINQMQYNAAVNYSAIREMPTTRWETQSDGKRLKRYLRKEHIQSLAIKLAEILDMDAQRIEDLIHSKASFYDHSPFVLKYDISERQYYLLKNLEREWLGLEAQRVPRRHYPLGPVAGDVIGYMGAINRTEYNAFINERKALQTYLQGLELGQDPPLPEGVQSTDEAIQRLRHLEEQAYSINDFVGKTGIEAQFEQDLRGFHGKRLFHADSRGNYLRELPGARPPLTGQRILLTISAELQAYAEQLLAQNEGIRTSRVSKPYNPEAVVANPKEPWIRGGAIVALDPNSGEVLALASYPRIDPNDFIPSGDSDRDSAKRARIRRWFESDSYLAELWDGRRPLTRECCTFAEGLSEEQQWLTWSRYLGTVLDEEGDVRRRVNRLQSIGQAVSLQKAVNRLLAVTDDSDLCYLLNRLYEPDGHATQVCRIRGERKERMEAQLQKKPQEIAALKAVLDTHFSGLEHTYDKLLLVDLCRLAVCEERISAELLAAIGQQSLADYQQARQAYSVLRHAVEKEVREIFHKVFFTQWRKENEVAFLKERRLEEKREKKYARPYIDYLDAEENRLFEQFWNQHQWHILASIVSRTHTDERLIPYYSHLQEWKETALHRQDLVREAKETLRASIRSVDPTLVEEYLQAFREYKDLNQPLYGRYRGLRQSNSQQLEKHLAAAFYPIAGYGYGRSWSYRQAAVQGSIFKIVTGYQALIERYETLKESGSDVSHLNPLEIVDQAHRDGKNWNVGYTIHNKPIPQMYKGGRIPRSLSRNIGRIDLPRAIETSSNPYFALLASDHIQDPSSLADAARNFSYGAPTGIDLPGEIAGNIPDDLEENRTGLYSFAIGQHALVVTPLQTATMLAAISNGGTVFTPQIRHLTVGATPLRDDAFLARSRHYPYEGPLASIGIDFPLFAATAKGAGESRVVVNRPQVKRHVPVPQEVRTPLLEGMEKVALHYTTHGLDVLRQLYEKDPTAVPALANSKGEWVGKTSTGESTERMSLERLTGTQTYNHIWFAGVSFNREETPEGFLVRDRFGNPELVVLVYLRFGGTGKEVAPIAAQVLAKWREIQAGRK